MDYKQKRENAAEETFQDLKDRYEAIVSKYPNQVNLIDKVLENTLESNNHEGDLIDLLFQVEYLIDTISESIKV